MQIVIPLSLMEQKVLDLFEQGLEQKEIAALLGCSINTVKTHAKRIVVKMVATNMRNAAWLRRQNPRPRPRL